MMKDDRYTKCNFAINAILKRKMKAVNEGPHCVGER